MFLDYSLALPQVSGPMCAPARWTWRVLWSNARARPMYLFASHVHNDHSLPLPCTLVSFADNGMPSGLNAEELEASVATLTKLAKEFDAKITVCAPSSRTSGSSVFRVLKMSQCDIMCELRSAPTVGSGVEESVSLCSLSHGSDHLYVPAPTRFPRIP